MLDRLHDLGHHATAFWRGRVGASPRDDRTIDVVVMCDCAHASVHQITEPCSDSDRLPGAYARGVARLHQRGQWPPTIFYDELGYAAAPGTLANGASARPDHARAEAAVA